MTDLLLSLCVPTYNRAPLLRQALEAVLAQITEGGFAAQTEVVVSDNASADETPVVLAEVAAAYPDVCLCAFCQTENKGPDANIYQAVKMARGEFVYIISDDDVLLPGGVQKLLAVIKTHQEIDAVSLNIRSFTSDPNEDGPVWFPVSEDTIVSGREAAISCFRPMQLMFLSVFAFRRTLSLQADYSVFDGTNLLQSYLFMDILAQGRGLAITSQPFLAQRKDNTGGWTFWRVMTTNLRSLMDYASLAGIPATAISALMHRHLTEDLYTATRYFKLTPPRKTFTPTPAAYWDGVGRLLRVYGPEPFLLGRLIPLMLTPSLPLRQIRRLIKGLL